MSGVPNEPVRVEVRRGTLLESWHEVHGVLWRGDRLVRAWGDPGLVTTLRSAWKLVQALPLVVDGAADAMEVPPHVLAAVAGSHSGQPEHVAAVDDLLARAGLGRDALVCGGHRPYHGPSADALAGAYGPVHDNCSGKHAGMLAWCVHEGLAVANYQLPEHPVQRRVIELLDEVVGDAPPRWPSAVDGCGVPTVAMPLAGIAAVFAKIAGASAGDEGCWPAVARIRDAIAQHPLMVAGTGRADTQIIKGTQGRLWTKSGAEGLWVGFERTTRTGFAFKAVDGEFRAPVPAALEALMAAGVLDQETVSAVSEWHRPAIRTRGGTVVGHMVPVLP